MSHFSVLSYGWNRSFKFVQIKNNDRRVLWKKELIPGVMGWNTSVGKVWIELAQVKQIDGSLISVFPQTKLICFFGQMHTPQLWLTLTVEPRAWPLLIRPFVRALDILVQNTNRSTELISWVTGRLLALAVSETSQKVLISKILRGYSCMTLVIHWLSLWCHHQVDSILAFYGKYVTKWAIEMHFQS